LPELYRCLTNYRGIQQGPIGGGSPE
jgi:hypothetical protein